MYRVLCDFADKTDKGFIYRCGEEFPRNGVEYPSAARIKELSGAGNALRRPLIALVVSEHTDTGNAPEKPVKGRRRKAKE